MGNIRGVPIADDVRVTLSNRPAAKVLVMLMI